MFKKKVLFVFIFIVVGVLVGGSVLYQPSKDISINSILSDPAYAYLPEEAKDYVLDIYNETGELILTEKNKQENTPYLNPEYVEYLTYTDEEKNGMGNIPNSLIVDYSSTEEDQDLNIPSSYDMRGKYITPVRDQGGLGLCWAFATAEVAESYILINDQNVTIDAPQLISERQIDYVTSRTGIKDYRSEYVSFFSRQLGEGGNFYISTIAMANGVSLVDYNSFKEYKDNDFSKMELSEVISYNKSLYEVNSTINMPRLNLRESTSILTEEEIETRNNFLNEVKKNVMANGGAYVGTYMSSRCQYVDSNLNSTVIDVYDCGRIYGTAHAMQIIGWNDDLEYTYCADDKMHSADITDCNNVVSGKGVWILRNSWGEELQYLYLTYDSLNTSINFISDMTKTENKVWDNNYILGTGYDGIKSQTYNLSESKILNDEKLEKIKFIANTPNTIYNIKINNSGSIETFSSETTLPGLITIDIDKDIIINEKTIIELYSEGSFIDKVSFFTSNIDTEPYIELPEKISLYKTSSRLYSETKNIPSGVNLTYELYDATGEKKIDNITFSNTEIAENNVNTLISLSDNLNVGNYVVKVSYDSKVIATSNVEVIGMEGEGTEESPYVITNSIQLDQIRNDLDAYYVLGNDIDLTEDTREGGILSYPSNVCSQGFGWETINDFSGSLDGQGHTIRGLYQNNYISCTDESTDWISWNYNGNGLFGTASGNVTIKNLVLEDFDISCYVDADNSATGSSCNILLSDYFDVNTETEYTVTVENIVLKNSYIRSYSSTRKAHGGGLIGFITSFGNVNVSNIYLNYDLEENTFIGSNYLFNTIQGENVNIENIMIAGNNDVSSIVGDTLIQNDQNVNVSVKKILSTAIGTENNHLFQQGINNGINAINVINNTNLTLCDRTCENATNVNFFDKDTELIKLTDKSNYSSWENFDDNWVIQTIDGIPRIPVLKFVDFEYTKIPDIVINQELNVDYNIYDYIEPKIESSKLISYKSNNESIVKIDENGLIVPQSTGQTTIHIESYYDGYINDVPVSINYVPHYNIYFNANGGTGTMDFIEAEVGSSYALPKNTFEREYYEFKEWNTSPDGTGISYNELDEIPAMNDKETITLYAIWIGEERLITFNPNGGTVTPDKKVARYKSRYGELPIPIRDGYAFDLWGTNSRIITYDSIVEDTYLTAVWIENAYTIIYNANGGKLDDYYNNSVRVMSDTVVTSYGENGISKILNYNYFKNVGYSFKKWNTEPDGSGTSYANRETIILDNVENSILTLYAIWEEQPLTLTLDANKGTFNGSETTIVIENWNENEMNKVEIPIREGYIFKEWNTALDGSGTTYKEGETITISEDVTLYAIWEPEERTITYNSNNSMDEVNTLEYHYNDQVSIIKNAFTNTGYTFVSWNTASDGTGDTYTENEELTLTENLTLYAIWKPEVRTITYNSNNSMEEVNTLEYHYNDQVSIIKNTFTNTGYTFVSWNTASDGTGDTYTEDEEVTLTENLTLYAIWKESFDYKINNYSEDKTNNYISKIMVNTTVDDFKNNIVLANNYSVEVEYKEIDNNKVIYTGGKTQIYKGDTLYKELTNVVIGDITEDGIINSADLLMVRRHLLGSTTLEGIYFLASDIDYNSTINSADLLRIRQHLLGTNPISQ